MCGKRRQFFELMLLVMSRTVAEISGSDLSSSSTLRMELSTVAWLRPPNSSPISLRGRFVRLRMRYMAIWRAMAVFLLRLCPRRSAPLSWNERADSSIMTSGVGMYVPVRMTSLMARLTESTVIVSSRMSL